jgi:hypothetical protein
LALHRHPSGIRVCKVSELGYGYSKLIERFRTAFPGHTHTWIAERFGASSTTTIEDDLTVLDEEDTSRSPVTGNGGAKGDVPLSVETRLSGAAWFEVMRRPSSVQAGLFDGGQEELA